MYSSAAWLGKFAKSKDIIHAVCKGARAQVVYYLFNIFIRVW